MSMLDRVFNSYPYHDPIDHQFVVALIAASITAGIFRLINYLTGYQINPEVMCFCSYGACYIVMLAVIGCARRRYYSPRTGKGEFLRSFISCMVAMIFWIAVLYLCEYYDPYPMGFDTYTILYRALGLAVPLNGALILGTDYAEHTYSRS